MKTKTYRVDVVGVSRGGVVTHQIKDCCCVHAAMSKFRAKGFRFPADRDRRPANVTGDVIQMQLVCADGTLVECVL